MTSTWRSADTPPPPRLTAGVWLRFVLRLVPAALVLAVCLALLALLRPVERRRHGLARPWTAPLQRVVSRVFLAVLGIRLKVTGRPMRQPGALVSNHVSWMDIFALSAPGPVFFVSKAEVQGWPGIGALARAAGTVFIDRRRGEAKRQQALLLDRLQAGQRLLFFPEGTSTDGKRVLPFKTSLFAAFLDPALRAACHVQPVTLLYHPPRGTDPRFYGWWGDMDFGASFVKVVGARRQGRVEVIYHAPLEVADFPDRKALAAECERQVRAGMPWDWQRDA